LPQTDSLINELNAPNRDARLAALSALAKLEQKGAVKAPEPAGFVNNHIHTTYSFSPYSPSMALWLARRSGLVTAGIMDHDSVGGCEEFLKAGRILNMAVTCGMECRVRLTGTALDGRRVNNPDQLSVAYVAMHGIPRRSIGFCEAFIAPYRKARNARNRAMAERINAITGPFGVSVDFERDVLPLSNATEGGSVTERHLLFALAKKLRAAYGKGEPLLCFLKEKLALEVSEKVGRYLLDPENPYYEYDLLGALKSALVERFYIPATDELPHISDFIAASRQAGAISAYAYLGDVGDSVTGDKKTQKFEDDYLELLFDELTRLGFHAVTYMPSRNTPQQLERVMALARRHGLFEISGEDINSPRQSFICKALEKPEFAHLSKATWALIGHERMADVRLEDGMFSDRTTAATPSLSERVERFAAIGAQGFLPVQD